MEQLPPSYIDEALSAAKVASGVSLTFAGTVEEKANRLHLRHFAGRTVGALNGLIVAAGHGLGGRAMKGARPLLVDDYLQAPFITHKYDRAIALEGLSAMAAVPVIVNRRPVAIMYAAVHGGARLGSRAVDALTLEVRSLEQRVVASRAGLHTGESNSARADLRDRMTAAFAHLNAVARQLDDRALRDHLARATELLMESSHAGSDEAKPELTARELDVLTLAALGYTNAAIGESLGIKAQTAKGYMKVLMSKLGTSSRLEAAVVARRYGLIP